MADTFGPVTPAQKASRLSQIFDEAEALIYGVERSPEIVAFVPPKYQMYLAVVAASLGTIQNIAHLFTHPDAQAVAAAATGGESATSSGSVATSAASSGVVAPEQTGEMTSAPAQPIHTPDGVDGMSPEEYAAHQSQLAAKEPLPQA